MQLSTTGIGTFLTSLAWLFFYYRLSKNKSSSNDFVKYFKGFSLFFGLFFLVFSVPSMLFSDNSTLLGVCYLIGHFLCFIGLAHLVRVSFLLIKPTSNSMGAFIAFLLAGVATTILNIVYFNYPYVKDNVMQWGQAPQVGVAIGILSIIAFLPVAILFTKEAITQPKNRKRYGLIAAALFITIICGPLHDVSSSAIVLMIADALSIVACAMAFFGVVSIPKVNVAKMSKTVRSRL